MKLSNIYSDVHKSEPVWRISVSIQLTRMNQNHQQSHVPLAKNRFPLNKTSNECFRKMFSSSDKRCYFLTQWFFPKPYWTLIFKSKSSKPFQQSPALNYSCLSAFYDGILIFFSYLILCQNDLAQFYSVQIQKFHPHLSCRHIEWDFIFLQL